MYFYEVGIQIDPMIPKYLNLIRMYKRPFYLFIVFLTLTTLSLKAQLIILKTYPKVDVKISFPDNSSFKITDTIKFMISITNHEKITQKLLFGKPDTYN